jgi:hypothetical protein
MYSSVKIRGKDESGSSSNRVHATFSQKQEKMFITVFMKHLLWKTTTKQFTQRFFHSL